METSNSITMEWGEPPGLMLMLIIGYNGGGHVRGEKGFKRDR
jgi:hypothetical protein